MLVPPKTWKFAVRFAAQALQREVASTTRAMFVLMATAVHNPRLAAAISHAVKESTGSNGISRCATCSRAPATASSYPCMCQHEVLT